MSRSFLKHANSGPWTATLVMFYVFAVLGVPLHVSSHAADPHLTGVACAPLLSASPPVSGHAELHGACAICDSTLIGAVEFAPLGVLKAERIAEITIGARPAPVARIRCQTGLTRGPPRV